jgi:acyl-CoA synthetase (AMP-forming)/AMP-acid ligase II
MYTQAIAYHAENSPQSIALTARNGQVSFGRFNAEINRVAVGLREILPANAVTIGVRRSLPYADWLLTLALARLDRTTVSIPGGGPFPSDGFNFVDAIISLDETFTAGGIPVLHLSAQRLQSMLNTGKFERVTGTSGPDDPARIAVSSGTTGTNKAVQLTHGQVISRLKGGIFGSAMRNDRSVYCDLPIGTFGGFGMPMRTWYLGGTVYLGTISLDDIRKGVVRTLTTTPGGLDAIVSKLPAEAKPIEGLCVVVGGGHVSPSLVSRTLARLTTDLVMSYGSTETTTVAVSRAASMLEKPGLTGIVLPWVDVEVVDEAGVPVPYGESGDVRIRSVDMVHQYLGDAAASAKAFRDGWFYPGDVGRLDANRALYIEGRRDFVLNLNGYKIAPESIEQALKDLPGIADVAVTQQRDLGEVVRAVALVVPTDQFDLDAVREALSLEMPHLKNVVFQLVDAVPRNEMRKVERHLLAPLVQLPISSPHPMGASR